MKLDPANVLKICSVSLLVLGGVTAVATIALPGTAMANGQSGSSHGQSGASHGQSGSGHGQSGSSHGQSSDSHGQSGSSHDQSGSSHGQSNGNSGNGAIASELKWLNSAHANAMALQNANPDSQVGRDAAYKKAALVTIDKKNALSDAQSAYDAFAGTYTGPSSTEIQAQIDTADSTNADLQKQIDALDTTSPTYDSDKAALEAQMIDTTALEDQLKTAQDYEAQLAILAQKVSDAQGAYNTAAGVEQTALDTATGGRTLSDDALARFRSLLGL